MKKFSDFGSVISDIHNIFEIDARSVHTERWQSIDIKDNASARMVEYLHHSFMYDLVSVDDAKSLGIEIGANLPWAEDHFQERVCGEPINPGIEWANWPWGNSANNHREPDGTFNHNYMERYWPKYAGNRVKPINENTIPSHIGIRHLYGDLNNLVELLSDEPGTRQAYMPIWFPEDTGTTHSGRKPCTLGYHFIMRNGKLDVTYYIRSCDYIRHFRDDVYLTIRLLMWIINECRKRNSYWNDIEPGIFIMHITSLHMFINDYIHLYGRTPK